MESWVRAWNKARGEGWNEATSTPPLSPLSFLHPPSSRLVSKCSKCKGDNDGNTPLLLVLQQSGMGPVLKHAYNLQEQTNQPIIH